MINKIRVIRNAGIFADYAWSNDLPDFRQWNLCYGYNGSGKTTLTKLLAALPQGRTDAFPNLEYEVETDNGVVTQGQEFARKIRVFNEEYVRDNVHRAEGKTKPIFMVGAENKRLAEEIARDERLLSEMQVSRQQALTKREECQHERNSKFTDIATVISTVVSGQATRFYNKTNAERAFNASPGKELLQQADLEIHKTTLRQRVMKTQKTLSLPQLTYHDEEKELELAAFLDRATVEGRALCAQTVESMAIPRLIENTDIALWVEEGVELHKKHESKWCEYCNQPIPKERISDLVNHFNQADAELKHDIDALVAEFQKAAFTIREIVPVDKAYLYDELQTSYQAAREAFTDTQNMLVEAIADRVRDLTDKKSHTTETVVLSRTIDLSDFAAAVARVNAEIERHNAKTRSFESQQQIASKKLEVHYLSTIYDSIHDLDDTIRNCNKEIERLEHGDQTDTGGAGITALRDRIAANRAAISSLHKGCAELNDRLRTFLGRDELVFEAEDDGYVIQRRGEVAEDLSEGERNAIAFVYFTTHLKDQDFAIADGIVAVDDPVSSLDSNSQFQAFSLLKNAVKGAHQVFLFTHNFDFLRLLLGWLKHRSYSDKRSFYMLQNPCHNGDRGVCLSKLDRLLEAHESEYHYLYKRLHGFMSDGTIESVYDIPNVARKVLETFLMFRVPNNENIYQKLEHLDFDERKRTAIYKFTNDQSHMTGKGFDPSLVQETQKNVAYLLEMIETVFPEHHRILVESLNS